MYVNTATGERIVRIILGTIFLIVGFFILFKLNWVFAIAIFLVLFGIFTLFIGISGFCPVYALFGISRAKKKIEIRLNKGEL
ncbi:MAG: DUF2892 domain-containing protein [Deltaproteobacteria bacterium]|nr:DUF2892 domain-containing protein [Deltaproteobacteria bacterium]